MARTKGAAKGRKQSDSDFSSLLEFSLDSKVFSSNWSYCDFMSSYVAKMVSHTRSDPFKSANLLSATLNELFETVYRIRNEKGGFRFEFLRSGTVERVKMTVPCDAKEQQSYIDAVKEVYAPDALESYTAALFSEEEQFDWRVGLFELVVSYDASITVAKDGKNAICLTTDLVLEREEG